MFWREHSYVAFSTTYVGYLTLRRKSAYLRRKKYHANERAAHSGLISPQILPFSKISVVAQRVGSSRLRDGPGKWLGIARALVVAFVL